MKYIGISTDDMNNGPGLRVVLWIAGCDHHCKGCHNPETWNYDQGHPLETDEQIDNLLKLIGKELRKDYVDGITFSGGDPLSEANIHMTNILIANIRMEFPNKTIWVYTGNTYEELNTKVKKEIEENHEYYWNAKMILDNIDVLVDGKYEELKRSPEKPWVGSSNQNVIILKN